MNLYDEGIPVIILTHNSYDFLIFYYYDGSIYASQEFMWFHNLKENGIIYTWGKYINEEFGIGIAEERISGITLNQDRLDIILLAYWSDYDFYVSTVRESEDVSYFLSFFIGDTRVTREEFTTFSDMHNIINHVVFYDFYLN